MSPLHLYGPPSIFFILAGVLLGSAVLTKLYRETPAFFLFVLAISARSLFYLWLVSMSYHVPGTISTRVWPGPWELYNAVLPWFPIIELMVVQESLWTTSAMVRSRFGPVPWWNPRDVMIFCWMIGGFVAGLTRWLRPSGPKNMSQGAYLWLLCAQLCCVVTIVVSLALLWLAFHWTFTSPEYIWRQAILGVYMTASVFGKRPQQDGDWWSTTDIQTSVQILAISGWLVSLTVYRRGRA